MSFLKICIVAPYDVFSDFSGAPKRVFSLAKGLNDQGASVYILHHGSSRSVTSNFELISFDFFDLGPGMGNYFHPLNPHYPIQLRRFLRKCSPDVIQCEAPWSVFPTLLFSSTLEIPYVLDEHNVEFLWSLHASRVPFLAPTTFVLEQIATFCSSLILATSHIDKNLIMKMFHIKENKLAIVPNGVDTSRFSHISVSQDQLKANLGFAQKKKIVMFHGTMSARPNYEAAQLIVSSIAPKIDATFVIIGADPPQWLRANAKKHENVLLLGYVPNIEEYIMAADVCVVPICRGSGTRLKMLEYLAAGKPIVSTITGAEGLPVKSGVHAFLCQQVDSVFTESVQSLLEESKAKELGVAGRKLAEKFDWSKISKRLYDIYLTNFNVNKKKSV